MKNTRRLRRIAFFIPFQGCARRCVYCDQKAITGTGGELSPETVRRTLASQTESVELCYFGGSFARLSEPQMAQYLDAINVAPAGSKVTFSSYPGDFTGSSGAARAAILTKYPIGTVELGVPSLDPVTLRACGRDDDPGEILSSIRTLRDAGFHLGVQIMIGLPGQEPGRARADLRQLAALKRALRWDLRVYPCLVLRGTELEELYNRALFTPLSLEEAIRETGQLLVEADALGFDVIRVGLLESESLRQSVIAGPYHPAFGELARAEQLALRLYTETPNAPRYITPADFSRLSAHKKQGLRRLAELDGLSLPEVTQGGGKSTEK